MVMFIYLMGLILVPLLIIQIPQLNKDIHHILLNDCNNPIFLITIFWPLSVAIILISFLYNLLLCSINYISGNGFESNTQKHMRQSKKVTYFVIKGNYKWKS